MNETKRIDNACCPISGKGKRPGTDSFFRPICVAFSIILIGYFVYTIANLALKDFLFGAPPPPATETQK